MYVTYGDGRTKREITAFYPKPPAGLHVEGGLGLRSRLELGTIVLAFEREIQPTRDIGKWSECALTLAVTMDANKTLQRSDNFFF